MRVDLLDSRIFLFDEHFRLLNRKLLDKVVNLKESTLMEKATIKAINIDLENIFFETSLPAVITRLRYLQFYSLE